MKYLLLLFIVGWIGCRDKTQESEYEWVQLQAPDTVYMNGLVVTKMTTMVKKYKDETLDQCIKRMDSTYGTNLFSVHYVNQLLDIEVSGEVIDSDALRINDSTILRFNSVGRQDGIIQPAITADSYGWNYDVDTASLGMSKYTSNQTLSLPAGSYKLGGIIQSNTTIKKADFNKCDTIYIYRDTCKGLQIIGGRYLIANFDTVAYACDLESKTITKTYYPDKKSKQ